MVFELERGTRKRAWEALTPAYYAQYGMTTGVLLREDAGPYTCGILCWSWPAWAFGALLRGWLIAVILIKEASWKLPIQNWFPQARVILIAPGLSLSREDYKINAWFSDLDLPRSLDLWSTDAKVIVSSRRFRHVPDPRWKMTPHTFTHQGVGGVTDGCWTFFVYSRNSQPLLPGASHTVGFRDMSSILDSHTSGMPVPAPTMVVGDATMPKVFQLRPNTYHGGGLMPWSAWSAFVIAPCIFSPTKWVRRRCSLAEQGEIFDLPTVILKRLTALQIRSLLSDTSIHPQRVLLRILDSITSLSPAEPSLLPTLIQPTLNVPLEQGEDSEQDYSSDSTIKHANLSLVGHQEAQIHDHEMDSKQRNAKAAKNDDAPVPEYLWDLAIVPDGNIVKIKSPGAIRSFALRWWKKHVTKDFFRWFNLRHAGEMRDMEYVRDTAASRDCLSRCSNSSWWEWDNGSRPLFWHWPEEYRNIIRDGLPPWIKGPMPRYMVPQRPEKDPSIHKNIISKLRKVREKRYIVPGPVLSLTSFFAVPKGDGDVRLVYDATKSGLNAQLWAPWFLLPTVESHLRCLAPGYYMGDIDFSEQFLNFMLHEKVQPYAGVDLTMYFGEELTSLRRVIWEHWGKGRHGVRFFPIHCSSRNSHG